MGSEATSMRQFHEIDDAELSDLADAVVRSLVLELQRLRVAGAAQADTWTLAEHIRDTVRRSHEAAFRRALAERLERAR
jgi:hypothetical protein